MNEISSFDLYVRGMSRDLRKAKAALAKATTAPNPDPKQIAQASKEIADAGRLISDFQKRLEAKIKKTHDAGGKLKALFVVPSPVVTAYHTGAPVDVPYPQCGADDVTTDEIYDEVSDALSAISGAAAPIPTYGTAIAIIAEVLSIAVEKLGQRHQSHARCVTTFSLVPSCLDLADIDLQVFVGQNQNPTANPRIDPYYDNWWGYKHVDKPALSTKTVAVKVASTDPANDNGYICQMKVLSVQMRNWSDSDNLQLYFRAYWDAPMKTVCSKCGDFGMVSEFYNNTWLFDPMDEVTARKLGDYLSEELKTAGEYQKEYEKDHPNS